MVRYVEGVLPVKTLIILEVHTSDVRRLLETVLTGLRRASPPNLTGLCSNLRSEESVLVSPKKDETSKVAMLFSSGK